MPAAGKYPRLRCHVRKGRGKQAYTYWYYDMRGTGEKDIPLGSDYATAVAMWDEIANGRPAKAGRLLEAIEQFRERELPAYTKVTQRGYKSALDKLQAWAGHMRWDEITVPLMAQYLAARTGKRQANMEISVLSVVWGKARLWGMTTTTWPAAGMKGWKNPEGKRAVEVGDDVYDAVLAEADWLLANAMRLAFATGARLTDCRLVELPDEGETMLSKIASKTGKPMKIRIVGAVLPGLVAERRTIKARHPYLLTTQGGMAVSERMLSNRWATARYAAAAKAEAAGNKRLAKAIRETHLYYMRKRAAQKEPTLEAARQRLQHDTVQLTRDHYRPGADAMDPVI